MILFSHGSTFPIPSLSSLSQLTSHQIFSSTFSLSLSLWRLKHMPTIRILVRTARRLIILIGLKRKLNSRGREWSVKEIIYLEMMLDLEQIWVCKERASKC
ncbi:hypothetical protein HanRHA438_Chr13g0581351 [Helianthus annuus]|uniref:Uncharacterized protein n=1 Tax=Helianthus annuus TaxID=4232 RepID=A0A9K3HA78_HELAN|nr:hypothetical protein HanXRQr2_Chr13g0570091 [Helianthus annuus]KAJ0475602.1 hypothetical protein HanHA300_Chr13g0467361 [Helianthus annuus]KAJ0479523.1 hypothetical protein HanIR_Chr13g0620941 [Helianthus annuus]KAJ0496383.1 hypothetical protein HanHA89_Chr13g0499091 [Helianthus annuus]KAJ0662442.1 hypothetical protein HanLR1_Chr13g0469521 [Helianthus annuus]